MKYWKFALAGAAGALLGAALLLGVLRAKPEAAQSLLATGQEVRGNHKTIDPSLLPFRSDPPREEAEEAANEDANEAEEFFQNPFAHMQKIREQMDEEMRAHLSGMPGLGHEEKQNVVRKEDDKFISYEINGVDATKLNTSVKDGYLTISGETRRESGQASMQSSFRRIFPLPSNVDAAKMETTSEKDKVILRFPKRKAS